MASRVMKIRKRSGGLRTIELPPEHVKVAQRQLLRLLTHNSREDLSVPQALYRFVENINTGFHWVASMDIKDCFTSINPKKTLARIDTRITEGVPGQYGRRSLPQGHPISPFLANTYLRQFDQMAA
ncbi:MAG: reverse transcriptase domain-containing protein, partial [Candidatus Bathyarchaeia archaeon]